MTNQNAKYLIEESSLPENLPVVQPAPGPNSPPHMPNFDRYAGGALPPALGLQTDLVQTNVKGTLPVYRLMPAPPSGSPQVGSAHQSNLLKNPAFVLTQSQAATASTTTNSITALGSSSALNKQGSVVPVTETVTPFTLNTGLPSNPGEQAWIDIGWSGITKYRSDGSSISIAASSTASPAPHAPTLTQVAGGSKIARTQFVRVAYVKDGVLRGISPEQSISISANNLMTVASPPSQTGMDGWVPLLCFDYAGATNQERVVIAPGSPLPFGTSWTEGTTDLYEIGGPYQTNNMDAETGNFNFWKNTGINSTWAISTTSPHGGVNSFQMTGTAAGSFGDQDHCSDSAGTLLDYLAVNPGEIYRLSGWVYPVQWNGSTQFAGFQLITCNSSKVDQANNNVAVTSLSPSTGSWIYVNGTFVIPAGISFIRIRMLGTTGAASPWSVWRFDDIRLVKVSSLGSNFNDYNSISNYGAVAVNLGAGLPYKFYPRYNATTSLVEFPNGPQQSSTVNLSIASSCFTDTYYPLITSQTPLAITTPASGGGSGSGTGGQPPCVRLGTPIRGLGGIDVYGTHTPADEWINLRVSSGASLIATPSHCVISAERGKVHINELSLGEKIVMEYGEDSVESLTPFSEPDTCVVARMETGHLYWAGEPGKAFLSHNIKA